MQMLDSKGANQGGDEYPVQQNQGAQESYKQPSYQQPQSYQKPSTQKMPNNSSIPVIDIDEDEIPF
jgi:single-stranded DNA-binding protein